MIPTPTIAPCRSCGGVPVMRFAPLPAPDFFCSRCSVFAEGATTEARLEAWNALQTDPRAVEFFGAPRSVSLEWREGEGWRVLYAIRVGLSEKRRLPIARATVEGALALWAAFRQLIGEGLTSSAVGALICVGLDAEARVRLAAIARTLRNPWLSPTQAQEAGFRCLCGGVLELLRISEGYYRLTCDGCGQVAEGPRVIDAHSAYARVSYAPTTPCANCGSETRPSVRYYLDDGSYQAECGNRDCDYASASAPTPEDVLLLWGLPLCRCAGDPTLGDQTASRAAIVCADCGASVAGPDRAAAAEAWVQLQTRFAEGRCKGCNRTTVPDVLYLTGGRGRYQVRCRICWHTIHTSEVERLPAAAAIDEWVQMPLSDSDRRRATVRADLLAMQARIGELVRNLE